jgi:hypothetical protein
MAILVWTMVGIALWHFTIFVPDRFWGGIIGAFVGAWAGAILFGFLIHGFSPPGRDDVSLLTALEAIPGAILGVAAIYALGARQERTRHQHA